MDQENRKEKRADMNIGVVILATKAYILLGLRFIHKWRKHYTGNKNITFYLFTDSDPKDYIDTKDIVNIYVKNKEWVEGANLKFSAISSLRNMKEDYLFFFDADTNIKKDFDESWFIGDRVGGQHFGDQMWMKDVKDYDRNPNSTAYVPLDTDLDQMYYYGAFFGGTKEDMIALSDLIIKKQKQNKEIGHEPIYNDESYLNREFHYNPPTRTIMCSDFKFVISDKGSMDGLRNETKDIDRQLDLIRSNKNKPFDVIDGEIRFI